MKIIEERDNRLLKRKDLIIELDYERGATVSKAALQLAVSKQSNAQQDKIEISKVLSETGKAGGKAIVKIWNEKSGFNYAKEKPEEKKEEAKKEEKPAEEKKEEKTEEVKEEPKEEAKPEKKEGETNA